MLFWALLRLFNVSRMTLLMKLLMESSKIHVWKMAGMSHWRKKKQLVLVDVVVTGQDVGGASSIEP